MTMTIVVSFMNVSTVQPTVAIGIDVHVQSTELQGQNACRQYDGKQCRAYSHRRSLHEAQQSANFTASAQAEPYDPSFMLASIDGTRPRISLQD